MEGGSELQFIALGVEGDASVGVFEFTPFGGRSLSEVSELADGNPREIFHAVSEPGEEEPPLLASLYDEPTLGDQGWFLDELASGGGSQESHFFCPSQSTFRNGFEAWYSNVPNNGGGPERYLGDNEPPGGEWNLYNPFGQCSNCQFFRYWPSGVYMYNNYWKYNVDQWKNRVAVCEMYTARTVNGQGDHGPYLAFRYRTENNTAKTAWFRDLQSTDHNALGYYSWYWSGAPNPGNNNWDWKVAVELAKPNDVYRIGWAYDHEGW